MPKDDSVYELDVYFNGQSGRVRFGREEKTCYLTIAECLTPIRLDDGVGGAVALFVEHSLTGDWDKSPLNLKASMMRTWDD